MKIERAPALTPLEACHAFLRALDNRKRSGLTPKPDYSDWDTLAFVMRETIAEVTK